jgi:DNA-binding response OmpR family regulator
MPYKKDPRSYNHANSLPQSVKRIEACLPTNSTGTRSEFTPFKKKCTSCEQSGLRGVNGNQNIHDSCEPLEKYISHIVNGEGPPDRGNIIQFDKIPDYLKRAVENPRVNFSDRPVDPKRFDLILLHREQRSWKRIEEAIALRNWKYRSVSNLSELQDELVFGAKVFLIDTSYLPALGQLLGWLHSHRDTRSVLFFISDCCDIRTRIKALRAGAKKLFLEPVNLNALIKAIEAIIQPKSVPDFRVLIIADDESKAISAAELLHNNTFETLILTEPLEVIDSIWRFLPNLILMLDLRMPELDNIVLTKLIRDREESVAIPIIFLSNDDDPVKEQQTLQAGADDYLSITSPQQLLLTAIKCRIERTKAIAAAGVHKSDESLADLPDRKAMLLRLEQVSSECDEGMWFYGVVVISLDTLQVASTCQTGNSRDQLITTVIEGIGPLLQVKDYLARVGYARLAILIRRGSKKELEHLVDLANEVISYRLSTHMIPVSWLGTGLVILEDGGRNTEELLQHGEMLAYAGCQQRQTICDSYSKLSAPLGRGVKEVSAWQREEFMHVLQSGSLNLRALRYFCLNEGVQTVETIELMPSLDDLNYPVDIYQQAALCEAAADFNRVVCEWGIQRLYEYSHQGKPVRLILRQSAAVLDDRDYIDSIKCTLRRLQIVGSGLVFEFALPSIAFRLRQSAVLFGELSALGVGISLSHFPCNKSGYKALAYLKAVVVRPRSSLLYGESNCIEWISRKIHSQHAEIILPDTENIEKISSKWWECADYVQADFPRQDRSQGALREDLLSLYLGAYRGLHRHTFESANPTGGSDFS